MVGRRVFLLVFLATFLVANSFASSDRSDCFKTCGRGYKGKTDELASCRFGCDNREGIKKGYSGVKNCLNQCSTEYSNATATEEEKKSCDFACSLPFEKKTMLHVFIDMNGNGPVWNIEQTDENGVVQKNVFSGFGQLGRSALFRSSEKDKMNEKAEKIMNDEFLQLDKLIQSEFFPSQDQSDSLIKSVLHDMIEKVRSDFKPALERPNGHGDAVFLGTKVGNIGPNGPIIREAHEIEDRPDLYIGSEYHNTPSPSFEISNSHAKWFSITFGCIVLLTIVFILSLCCRTRRVEYYMPATPQGIVHVLPPKKSMIEEDAESSISWQMKQPDGDAPPAYDTVSIHEQPK